MLEFIQLIKQRYQSLLRQMDKRQSRFFDYQQRVEQLLYAEAFIRKGQLIESYTHFPLQIAVIGPTQAGKSSIVNLLLNSTQAGVSPLAGYTVHPHGYCHGVSSDDCDGMQHYFGRFQCLEQSQLNPRRFDCYSLANNQSSSALLPACVCWDTPDFDSIDSADYREGVIRTIALADLIILVVSKEKYADQSVWEVMKTIASFQQPTMICVNKLSEGSEAQILNSLQQKWRQHRQDQVPEIVPLSFQKQIPMPIWPAAHKNAVHALAKKVSHKKHFAYQQQWLNRYWQQWLEPVLAEHHAQHDWQLLVDQCIGQALKDYQRDYLDHPHHYDTFQNALLNMLTLLEIPGIAKIMGKARRAMTWPVRKLMSLGKEAYQGNAVQEVAVLNQICTHIMIRLADKLLEKNEIEAPPADWWKETAVTLRQKKMAIQHEFEQAAADYHLNFQMDVEETAQKLYYKLQEQPLTLNSLRATRASTDVAAILMALQTGGIGIQDLVLTPIMLTLTSLLTESAIGSYMNRLEAELKRHQLNTVKSKLFLSCLQQSLYPLPQQTASTHRFNIPEQQCRLSEQSLIEKKHGLRLL